MNNSEDEFEPSARDIPPDPSITPELFREWRSPRFGTSNPERMDNPVWEWLIRSRLNAYQANEKFNGPDSLEAGPCWCFDRFGQSSTLLPDGRNVLIAGEHEDFYDADFKIYNDVVVIHPDGRIECFGYPEQTFPPTDFHSATLVDNQIIIIGNLSYPEARKAGTTPVFVLNLDTFAISSIVTSGTLPGWIHEHKATLSKDGNSILVQHGKLDRGDRTFVENIDDWKLRLADWHWERLTERKWQRWEFRREDRRPNHLWEIEQAVWNREVKWEKELKEGIERLKQEIGIAPDLDLFPKLYVPDVPHETIPNSEDEYRVFRIRVNGVIVRYVQDSYSIQMTVEGELPPDITNALVSDLQKKLTALENFRYEAKQF